MGSENIFDFPDWPIRLGESYRAVDPPKELEGLVVTVTFMKDGVIDCEDKATGRPFSFESAAEFRRLFEPN